MEEILDNENHYSEDRDDRVKETAEVFTPGFLVKRMLDDLDVNWDNIDNTKTFLDPTCGSGNFLVELAKRGVLLKNIYGVDLMEDNIETTKKRLTELYPDMSTEDLEFHLERNIICADALTYHYEFWWHSESIVDDDW